MLNSMQQPRSKKIRAINLVVILMAIVILSACAGSKPALDEEARIQAVVEEFGQKLKLVSLLSPSAAEDLKTQYSNFVSTPLLQQWMGTPEKAPGRMVSSPWPDRIEISSIRKTMTGEYSVTGNIVEITSAEVSSGGFTDKIPIQITVKNSGGSWLIVAYSQEKSQP